MASSKLNQTNLTFTDSSSNTGILDFTANEFNVNKQLLVNNSITSTQNSVSGSEKVTTISSVNTLNIGTLTFNGSTSGGITLQANPTTTTHTLTFPDSQGTAGTYLTNNGSGDLSWIDFNENHYGESGDRKYAGYIDIRGTRIQYGMNTSNSDDPQTINLPASFSDISYSIQLSISDATAGNLSAESIGVPIWIKTRSTSSFQIKRDGDISNIIKIYWVAIGQV